MDRYAQQKAERIDEDMACDPWSSCPHRSPAGRARPPFCALLTLWLSMIAVVGLGFNTTANDGATLCIAANWPIPSGEPRSRRAAARVKRGAICLSNSSHFALMLYS